MAVAGRRVGAIKAISPIRAGGLMISCRRDRAFEDDAPRAQEIAAVRRLITGKQNLPAAQDTLPGGKRNEAQGFGLQHRKDRVTREVVEIVVAGHALLSQRLSLRQGISL